MMTSTPVNNDQYSHLTLTPDSLIYALLDINVDGQHLLLTVHGALAAIEQRLNNPMTVFSITSHQQQ